MREKECGKGDENKERGEDLVDKGEKIEEELDRAFWREGALS